MKFVKRLLWPVRLVASMSRGKILMDILALMLSRNQIHNLSLRINYSRLKIKNSRKSMRIKSKWAMN